MNLDRYHRRVNAGERATSHDRNRHGTLSPLMLTGLFDALAISAERARIRTTLAQQKGTRLQPFG
jgi:hypothetical protein